MIIERVLYFGATDSPDARDSVFLFLAAAPWAFAGVGCDGCRAIAPAVFRAGEVLIADPLAFAAAEEFGL